MRKSAVPFLITFMVGLVFLSEGIQKFLFPMDLGEGRFEKIGVPYPEITAYIIAAVEIAAGAFLLCRFYVKYISIPLLLVILGAIYFTKIPSFIEKGFWITVHEGRTDFLMLFSLIFIVYTEFSKARSL